MNEALSEINKRVYQSSGFKITNLQTEKESQEYDACQFELNGLKIISRTAKRTPKKAGQFVTFWKRKDNGPIEPFHEADSFDFFIVNIRTDAGFGLFVFPKSILVQKGIISTDSKEGKRAFRVYPEPNKNLNKTAERTQVWQREYFFPVHEATGFKERMTRISDSYRH